MPFVAHHGKPPSRDLALISVQGVYATATLHVFFQSSFRRHFVAFRPMPTISYWGTLLWVPRADCVRLL